MTPVPPRPADQAAWCRCSVRRRRVAVEGQVVADDRQTEALTPTVLGKPGGERSRLQRAAANVEALLHLGIGRGEGVEQSVAQHAELEIVEQPVDLVAIPRLHPQRVGGLRQRHVLDQIRQLAVEQDAGQVGAQRIADLALDLVDVVDQREQRAVFGDPFGRRLLADSRDAGQVVAGVSAQRREIGVLRRREAVLVRHRFRGESGELADPLHRVQHRDVVADQLQRIAVAGHHQHPIALVLGLGCQRRDHVVGFEPGLGQNGDAERAENLLGDVDLAAELVRRRRSARLVFRVLLQPERLARYVEGRRDMTGLLVTQQIDEHRGEAVDRVGGESALGLEVLGGQRIEGAEGQRVAVEEHQRRLVVSGRFTGLRLRCGLGWAHGVHSRHPV
jgi:hypothetical protein